MVDGPLGTACPFVGAVVTVRFVTGPLVMVRLMGLAVFSLALALKDVVFGMPTLSGTVAAEADGTLPLLAV